MRAAAEVRAALRELTHDTTTLASLNTIATRPGLELAATGALHSQESASELAYVIADKAEAPNPTGPARELSIRAHNETEDDLASRGSDVVWVSPDDIRARRIVPAPQPVIYGLRKASLHTVRACGAAAPAAAPAASAHYKTSKIGVLQASAPELGSIMWRPSLPEPAQRHRGR